MMMEPYSVNIVYCPKCGWMLRAAWMAQEILRRFEEDPITVSIAPGNNGQFDISLNKQLIYSRAETGEFPESKEIKQAIRDIVDPERDLGHSDK